MSKLAESLRDRFYGNAVHPYAILEQEIQRVLRPDAVVVDAGCGRTAPVLAKFRGKARRLIGVDLVKFPQPIDSLELYNWDLGKMELPDASVDLIYSRSVMEHVEHPEVVYAEMARILKPGGHFIFLTANKWDYASIIAGMIPNAWHPVIVRRTEGRDESDTFPTQYKTNTKGAITRLAAQNSFEIEFFRYLTQYPNYFMFNGALFLFGTAYHKLVEHTPMLHWLQGWIFVSLRKRA